MNSKLSKNKKGGYVALISAIIISFVLTGLAFTASRSGFFARFDSLNAEYKRVSKGLAESCVNYALLELAQNPDYSENETVVLASDKSCRIDQITFEPTSDYDGENKKTATIIAVAHYPDLNGAFSRIKVEAVIYKPQSSPLPAEIRQNIEIESWTEE